MCNGRPARGVGDRVRAGVVVTSGRLNEALKQRVDLVQIVDLKILVVFDAALG